ncbi:MAG TPA: HD domain-containing protein [Acidimicrobiia bacterium]|nr:HD domain-containing protein [Acidimicrobiia bacterium]
MSEPFADVDALFDALRASRDADDEGGLSILEHCLQCAELLRRAHADRALQVAGLVHDLGWLERSGDGWTLRLDAAHDVDGRALVAPLLGDRVASLVGGHVAAKRYLLTTDPGYATFLSHRSEVTLGFQGGLMDAAEVAAFERRPDRADLVALRRADDAAKVRGKRVDPLESWLPVVTGLCRSRGT